MKKLFIILCLCFTALSACKSATSDEPASETGNQNVVAEDTSGQNDEDRADQDETAQGNKDGDTDATAQGSITGQETDKEDSTDKRSYVSVTFSAAGGVYEEPFSLELTAEEGTIYYTTDGSDPTNSETRCVYESSITVEDRKDSANVIAAVDPVLFCGNFNEPLSDGKGFSCRITAPADSAVDKCSIIRAVAQTIDGTYGHVAAATYFIGTTQEHIQGLAKSVAAAGSSLAVISITMNYEDLFDSETGIYVKGDIFEDALSAFLQNEAVNNGETARSLDANYKQRGSEWERACHMEFFEFDTDSTSLELSQDCGIRIQGNYSRSDLQKGLRLIADSDYGDNNFRYEVFGQELTDSSGEVIDKFKNLVLRAGGNCAFTSKFNDTYWQTLVQDLSCETLASRPCVVYLNGEYFGLYVLQEDYDNDYFEDHYQVDKDSIVIYKGDAEVYASGYKLDEGELPEGEEDDGYYFQDLMSFFKTHNDLTEDEDYQELSRLVDVNSIRDYFAAEVWINNKWDWPGKNWSMWKTIQTDESNPYADGKWRLMCYDMEFGGVSGLSDARTNTVRDDNYMQYGLLDQGTKNPAVLCFAYLMTNEGFREEYKNTLLSMNSTTYEQQNALAVLDRFEAVYSPLYEQFFARYPGSGSAKEAQYGGYASISCIRDFLSERMNNIQKMLDWIDSVY